MFCRAIIAESGFAEEIMKIEHVALYVNNLVEARNFFVKYLSGHADDGYHNSNTGFRSYFKFFACPFIPEPRK